MLNRSTFLSFPKTTPLKSSVRLIQQRTTKLNDVKSLFDKEEGGSPKCCHYCHRCQHLVVVVTAIAAVSKHRDAMVIKI